MAPTWAAAASPAARPRKVAKGDYIMVPPNTPHQYADVQGELAMVTLHMPMQPNEIPGQTLLFAEIIVHIVESFGFRYSTS